MAKQDQSPDGKPEQHKPERPQSKQDDRGDGPSGVNQRDHGAADDKPMAGGTVNLDDDDMVHPRGKVTGAGRTWDEKNPSDAGDLGAPNVGMSDHNGPSDPDAKRGATDRPTDE